jgi:hypothetical protein
MNAERPIDMLTRGNAYFMNATRMILILSLLCTILSSDMQGRDGNKIVKIRLDAPLIIIGDAGYCEYAFTHENGSVWRVIFPIPDNCPFPASYTHAFILGYRREFNNGLCPDADSKTSSCLRAHLLRPVDGKRLAKILNIRENAAGDDKANESHEEGDMAGETRGVMDGQEYCDALDDRQ